MILSLLLPLIGCASKQSLDSDVDHLVAALAANDFDHFAADAHPALQEEISRAEFARMARLVRQLGDLRRKKMTGIEVKAGNLASGRYELAFANGNCDLEIKSKAGKVVAFRFSGGDVERLMKASR